MYHDSQRMHRHHGIYCWRHFPTKEEKIEHLEEYKKWLENETKGVQEAIDEIKKAS